MGYLVRKTANPTKPHKQGFNKGLLFSCADILPNITAAQQPHPVSQ